MANREAKERNRAHKGRTGWLAEQRRKKKGMKAKLHGKSKGKGGAHGTPPQGISLPKDPKN